MKKITPFHDAAKAFAHCEVCLDEIQREELPAWAYEFFFNSFIFYINQAWELAVGAFRASKCTSAPGQDLIDRVKKMRDRDDPLLLYVREARNQLAHRESVLWISDEEPKMPEGLGSIVNLGPSYYTTEWKRYSCVVLPSLSFNFVGTRVAAKPVLSRGGEMIAVPEVNEGQENSPLNIMVAAYTFYGKSFDQLFQFSR
uniref:hypothetical protein n=1 Tax=uncultured Halomonas sp. TaxID=173971 RepID=UPI00261EF10F|nr:hypothetical protein [uncultured Halomonas sp.]